MRVLVILLVVSILTLVVLRPASRSLSAAERPSAPAATMAPSPLIAVPQSWIEAGTDPWLKLAAYALSATLVGVTLLPFGTLAGLVAAVAVVCHPIGAVVVAAGSSMSLAGFLFLALALACLSRDASGWRVLGGLLAVAVVIQSNLAWTPFLLLFLASGGAIRSRGARASLTVAAVGLVVIGLLADSAGTLGWIASERHLGGAAGLRWAGALKVVAGLGPDLDWIAAGRLPVVLVVALGLLVAAGLEEATGRFPRSLVWAGPAAVAVAAGVVTITARTAADQAPSTALVLPAVAALALMFGAATHLLRESPRARIRSMALVPVAVPVVWLVLPLVGGRHLEEASLRSGAVELDPDLVYSRAVLDVESGRAAAGETASRLERALLTGPSAAGLPPVSRVRVALTCARLYRQAGDVGGALAAARAAREAVASGLPKGLADRARAEWLRARWQAGDRELDGEIARIEEDVVAGPESLLAAGQCLLAQATPGGSLGGRVPRIERLLHRALTLEPDHVEALLAMGELCARTDRLVDAARHLERAHRLAPGDADPSIRLARLYYSQGEDAEGAPYLAEALRVTTRNPMSTFALGRLLFEATPDKERGIDLMRAALDEQPGIPAGAAIISSCQGQLAALSLTRGDRETARRLATAALELDAANASAHQTIGRVAMQEGNLEEAVHALRAAWEQQPDLADLALEYAEAMKALGYQKLLGGDRPAAVDLFSQVLDLGVAGIETAAIRAVVEGPKGPGSTAGDGIGSAEQEGGATGRASPEVSAPVEPSAAEVATARALYEEGVRLLARGDAAAADEKLKASLSILPANPYAYLQRGRIALDDGRRPEALTYWRRARELAGQLELDLPEITLRLGLALATGSREERAEARPLLEAFLKDAADHPEASRAREVLDKLRKDALRERIPW